MSPSLPSHSHGRPHARFVILTSPRSGSTWLVDALNQHPQAVVYGEAFQPGRTRSFRFGARAFPPYIPYRRQHPGRHWPPQPVAYLNDLYASAGEGRAVGFKLMYGHARSHPLVAAHLRARSADVLHLVRENSVDAVISRFAIAARAKGQGHQVDQAVAAPAGITVDPARFIAAVKAHETAVRRAHRALAIARFRRLELTYERLFADPAGETGRVLDFLSLDPPEAPLGSALQRQATGAQGAHIGNFEAIRQALVAAGYGRHLRVSASSA